MKQTGASYQDAAIEFKMHNPTLIVKWKQTFLAEGAEGLRKKGRPPMAKNPKKKPAKPARTMSREEQLERENELLRLEVAYLKKLDAFQENPDAYLEKHKQRWHYQHRLWVKSLKQHRIFQSMSRKATCADNAAMENFFGLLKQEMYHGEELVSYEELKRKVERYVHYYNHERIKQKLAGMSPVNYRVHASQLAA